MKCMHRKNTSRHKKESANAQKAFELKTKIRVTNDKQKKGQTERQTNRQKEEMTNRKKDKLEDKQIDKKTK